MVNNSTKNKFLFKISLWDIIFFSIVFLLIYFYIGFYFPDPYVLRRGSFGTRLLLNGARLFLPLIIITLCGIYT